MANKKQEKETLVKSKNSDTELDFKDDWGDVDFSFMDDDTGEREPNLRDDTVEIAKEAAKSSASNIAKEGVRAIMPADFQYELSNVADMGMELGGLFKDSIKEVKGIVGSVLPKAWQTKMGLEQSTAASRMADERALREAEIENSLGKIFNRKDGAEEYLTHAREKTTEATGVAIDRLSLDALGNISNHSSKLTSFMTTIGSDYYRKSLELQYRSYYVNLDLLNTSKTFFHSFVGLLTGIKKNTGLPEYVKITQTERLGERLKSSLTDTIYNKTWSNNSFIQRTKKNIEFRVKAEIDRLRDTFGMATDMNDQLGDDPNMRRSIRNSLMGEGIGTMGGTWLGRKLGGAYNKRFAGKDDKLQGLGSFINNLGRGTSVMSTRARDWVGKQADDAEYRSGFGGVVSRMAFGGAGAALDLIEDNTRDTVHRRDNFTIFDKPAIFDNNVHRSITEGIPMYLSRILQSNEELVNKYSFVNSGVLGKGKFRPEGLLYNFQDRKLDTKDAYITSIDNAIKRDTGRLSSYTQASAGLIRGTENLFKQSKSTNRRANLAILRKQGTQEALTDYLTEMQHKGGVEMNYDTLFKDALDPKVRNPVIDNYIKQNKDLAIIIRAINEGSELGHKEKEISRMQEILTDTLEKADGGVPVIPVMDLFKGASLISGTETINTITTQQALVIAEGISRYMATSKKSIGTSYDSIVAAFSGIEKAKYDQVRDAVEVFLYEYRVITEGESLKNKEDLYALVIRVSNSISMSYWLADQGAKDNEKSLFTNLGRLNTELHIDNLSYRNYQLKSTRVEPLGESLSEAQIRDMTSGSPESVERKRKSIFDSRAFTKVDDIASDSLKRVVSGGKTAATVIKKTYVAIRTDGSKSLEKAKLSINRHSSNIGKVLGNLSDNTIRASANKLCEYLDSIVNEIRITVEEETALHSRDVKELQSKINEIDRESANPSLVSELTVRLSLLENKFNKRMTNYQAMSDELSDLSSRIKDDLDKYQDGDSTRFVLSIKEKIMFNLSKLQRLIKER